MLAGFLEANLLLKHRDFQNNTFEPQNQLGADLFRRHNHHNKQDVM
jgi:hypothetical protein